MSGMPLASGGRKGSFAAAGDRMLQVLSVASGALAAFALRGGPDFAREVRGRKNNERPIAPRSGEK